MVMDLMDLRSCSTKLPLDPTDLETWEEILATVLEDLGSCAYLAYFLLELLINYWNMTKLIKDLLM